jgi:hypothetical protein
MPGTLASRGNILYQFVIQPSLTPASVNANITAEQTFTVNGLLSTDIVDASCNVAQTAGIAITNSRVSAANTLALTFGNLTNGSLTPAAGAYIITVIRPENPTLPTNAG